MAETIWVLQNAEKRKKEELADVSRLIGILKAKEELRDNIERQEREAKRAQKKIEEIQAAVPDRANFDMKARQFAEKETAYQIKLYAHKKTKLFGFFFVVLYLASMYFPATTVVPAAIEHGGYFLFFISMAAVYFGALFFLFTLISKPKRPKEEPEEEEKKEEAK